MNNIRVKDLKQGQRVTLEVLGNAMELIIVGDAKVVNTKQGESHDALAQIAAGAHMGAPLILRASPGFEAFHPKLTLHE